LGRISVRKGIDQIVQLSHSLAENGTVVALRIVGGHTLWSDYRPLLAGINSDNTTYIGPLPSADVAAELGEADLLVQASKYEPFGLTVAEALASGVPVVATAAVGAIEGTSRTGTEVVPVGDVRALARAVETLVQRMSASPQAVRRAARADAERLYDPVTVAQRLSEFLIGLSSATPEMAIENSFKP
jgi:glycosyltransferase involved in cell wall biosynthesis